MDDMVEKRTKDLNSLFTKEDNHQMANNIKRLTSLIIRKANQNHRNLTVYTHQVINIKTKWKIPCIGETMMHLELTYCWWEPIRKFDI